IIDSGEYLPYGLDRSVNALLQTSAYKFTDQEQDDGTGLYNYDARLYDPVIGQFVMADTLVPDQFNPQSLNRYVYCLDNPVKYIDPSGHNPAAAPIIGLIIGVLIGHYADPYLDNIDSFFKDLKDKIKDKEESEPEVFTFDIQDSPLNPDNQDNKSKSAEPADKKDGIPDPDTSDPDTSDSDTSGRGFSGPTGLGGR
ncbi:MAG: RHS repeat-associated core domain-containing protein, partial [Proteobacteria bacterium]|nr:RHS repeat-associated core domain-containing protein [Pseudomonadota bacterium]